MCRSILLFIFLMVLCVRSQAQLCTGALGDPIVHITFGSGPNPGPSLSTAAPGYQYVANDCPNDGFYTVRNRTDNCFGATWHSVSNDHTGDANGYFMMVNASNSPGDFYVDTIRSLCSGTSYEFAAWVLNISRTNGCNGTPIQPNITFRIEKLDGTVLGTYNTGGVPPTPSPEWKQYGLFFTTPATVPDVVVRMTNNAPGGCGNDLFLDDITFRPCGALLTPSFIGEPGQEKVLCQGVADDLDLHVALSGGYTAPVFQWQESVDGGPWANIPGAVLQTYRRSFPATLSPGKYRYRLTVVEAANAGNTSCTVASPPLTAWVIGRPALNVINSGPVCAGSPVELTASGASTYSWSGPGGFSASGNTVRTGPLETTAAGTYTVTATDSYLCTWTGSTNVLVSARPSASVAADTIATCLGTAVSLQASGGTQYEWWPADGLSSPTTSSTDATPSDSTTYSVSVRNAGGCADTATVRVNVRRAPVADAGPDKALLLGESTVLEGAVDGSGFEIAWSPARWLSNPGGLQPLASPEEHSTYVLTARSLAGCGESSDTVQVRVFRKVEVPNVFTPNGDGVNDRWEIPALQAYRNYTLDVFNRWGQPVLRRRNDPRPWTGENDGKALPTGTYFYVLRIEDTGQRFSGFIDLIR